MASVTAIILAAGLSRRMGAANKLLLPVGGRPIIASTVASFTGVVDDVLVVTGHQAEAVRDALSDLPVRFVHNSDYAEGQASSVATGLRAVGSAEHVLVALGDQALLRPHHLSTLLSAHLEAGGDKISVPHNGTDRGNPIVIPGALLPRLLADAHNPGCGRFTRAHPEWVRMLPLPDRGYYTDIDTPEAYAAITQPKEVSA